MSLSGVVRKKSLSHNAKRVMEILMSDRDFDNALGLVDVFLRGHESWRVRRKYFLSISEILHLYACHKRFWGY